MDPAKPEESSTLQFHRSFAGFCRRDDIDDARIRKTQGLIRPHKKGLKILDLGCAGGYTVKPFIADHDVWGADGIDEVLEIARSSGLKTVKVDMEKPLPFTGAEFDIVVCTETIEHVVHTDLVMHEINRILKPAGTAVISVPNIRTPVGFAMLMAGYPPMYAARYRAGHVRDFTARTFKTALLNHGFEIEKFVGGTFWLPGAGDCLSGLATILPSWSSTMIARVIKRSESEYHPENNIAELY